MTDQTLNFCTPSVWEPIIEHSQHLLFNTNYLIDRGNEFRNQYLGLEDVKWPKVDTENCHFDQASQLDSVYAGYDLPITFTPDNWNKKFISLIAQDPLRTPSKKDDQGPAFTIATPWGFSNPKAPNIAHNRKLWPSIVAICGAGYGVYLTDAAKLYFHKHKKIDATKELEAKTFSLEMDVVKPVHTVVFGNAARNIMISLGEDGFDFHPHIAAYGALKAHYGTVDAKFDTIATALKNQVSKNSGINL